MVTTKQLLDHRVIVCCGPGGVGKTTAAATLAIAAARLGKRACVVTIDPAKRLANAMGLAALTNDPARVEGDWPGEVWALMLDVKATFDEVVRTHARTAAQAESILANPMYGNISDSLIGTQEYMAMEKLHLLYSDTRFDLIVVDTPPTRRALDFLGASTRLTRFLENKLFRMIVFPSRRGLRVVSFGAQGFLKVISKVVGGEVVNDAIDFFRVFEGMEEGFNERARTTRAVLGSPESAFVVVSSAEATPLAEAKFFLERLQIEKLEPEAIVFNRLEPEFVEPSPNAADELLTAGLTPAEVGALQTNFDEISARRHRQDLVIDDFLTEVLTIELARQVSVHRLERRAHDMATLATLTEFAEELLDS